MVPFKVMHVCLFFYSSGKPSDYSCPSGCVISNCKACYYSYTPLPLPKLDSSCPTTCISGGEINDDCLIKWGKCAHRGFLRAYPKVPVALSLVFIFVKCLVNILTYTESKYKFAYILILSALY